MTTNQKSVIVIDAIAKLSTVSKIISQNPFFLKRNYLEKDPQDHLIRLFDFIFRIAKSKKKELQIKQYYIELKSLLDSLCKCPGILSNTKEKFSVLKCKKIDFHQTYLMSAFLSGEGTFKEHFLELLSSQVIINFDFLQKGLDSSWRYTFYSKYINLLIDYGSDEELKKFLRENVTNNYNKESGEICFHFRSNTIALCRTFYLSLSLKKNRKRLFGLVKDLPNLAHAILLTLSDNDPQPLFHYDFFVIFYEMHQGFNWNYKLLDASRPKESYEYDFFRNGITRAYTISILNSIVYSQFIDQIHNENDIYPFLSAISEFSLIDCRL